MDLLIMIFIAGTLIGGLVLLSESGERQKSVVLLAIGSILLIWTISAYQNLLKKAEVKNYKIYEITKEDPDEIYQVWYDENKKTHYLQDKKKFYVKNFSNKRVNIIYVEDQWSLGMYMNLLDNIVNVVEISNANN